MHLYFQTDLVERFLQFLYHRMDRDNIWLGETKRILKSLVVRKPVFGVSNQVTHKSGCTATQDGKRLEISYLGNRGIVLCSKNKGADQLRGYCEADLRFSFHICKTLVFS